MTDNKEWFTSVKNYQLNSIKKYLQSGQDINAENDDGMTALHIACRSNNLELVKFLVDNKASINHQPEGYEITPLMTACSYGHMDIVKYLVEECNAKLNLRDSYGYTALMMACERGNLDLIIYLLDNKNIDVNIKNIHGHSAIVLALNNGLNIFNFFANKFDIHLTRKN